MKCFVDTSAWIAHFDKDDDFHEDAESFFRKKPLMVTSNIVIHETIAHLQARINKNLALTAGKLLFNDALVQLIIIDRNQEVRAWNEYVVQSKKISFVDCSIKVVMEEKKLGTIFAFDDDFAKLGLKVVP